MEKETHMMKDSIKNLLKDFTHISKAPKQIYWPTSTDTFDRLVKVADGDNASITVKLGKEQYISDILLNVEKRNEDEVISFNVNDIISNDKEKGEDFTVLGNILFIDKENNHVILTEKQYINVDDHILYMPKDIYLAIDLHTGNCVFKNADIDSELYIKYLAFFLIRKQDYASIEEENTRKPLEENDKYKINNSIDGYSDLTEDQKKEVNKILDELIYDNSDAHVEQFVSDASNENTESERLKIPLNDDGTVDINVFTNQICPKYAEKKVDLSTIEFEKEKNYIPVINDTDYTNLGLIGFAPKDIKNLISTMREALINSHKTLLELEEKIDIIMESYNKSLSTCCSLISTGVYNSSEFNYTIKNIYTPLAMMKEYENEYERAGEITKSAQNTLASFQNISRRYIQKAINDGEFTNKHTFSSLAVFFKTMLTLNHVNTGDVNDNYGVYNTYLKYINSKTKELNQYNYFNDMILNSLNPARNNSVYTLSTDLFNKFVRISDLHDTSKTDALERIIERVSNRINYLFEVSYFPINIASYVYFDLVKILSFNNDKDENIDFDTLYKTVMNKYEKNGWPTPQSISIENKLLEKAISFKAKLENPEILESLIGFLKIVRLTVLNEYMTKITAKQNKNNGEIFHTAINYILLEEIISYIDMITQKKCAVVNDKNEQEEKELTDNEQKCLIGRWLIKLVCYLLFSGTSLRLSNDMSNTASSIKDINENDIQTFFSVIINGLILSIELIDNAEDKGKDNDTYLDTVIPSERLKLLGSESSKIFYNGLKGMYVQNNEEKQDELFESTVSRLFVGRRELMEESVCFVENVLDIINKFIDEVSIGGTLMEKE